MHDLRKNNKGFTLVELIIVVAILAVLMALLAPQYIRYVEKARERTDAQAIGEIAHAAQIAILNDGSEILPDNTITVETTGKLAYRVTGTDHPLTDAVEKIVPPGSYTFKSKAYKDAASIEIEINDGQAEWDDPLADSGD